MLDNSIASIINCAPDIHCYFEDRFKYLHLHLYLIPDQIFTKQLKDNIVEFIDDNTTNGNVLVHCHEGRKRSPSVIILYFMSKDMAYHEAYNIVKMKRTQIEYKRYC